MEHFVSLMGVLEEFFDPDFDFLKNSAEILGIYGRVSFFFSKTSV